jgi:hypothetical protein
MQRYITGFILIQRRRRSLKWFVGLLNWVDFWGEKVMVNRELKFCGVD